MHPIDTSYKVCGSRQEENYIHKFYLCGFAHKPNKFGGTTLILYVKSSKGSVVLNPFSCSLPYSPFLVKKLTSTPNLQIELGYYYKVLL